LDEDLINEIENYLKDVMEQNEKVIDISETQIGNYGAKCVAAVLSLCDGLEEIRLSNCGIKDDGALELFEELKGTDSVGILDLSKNPLTEKCFDGLVQLLQTNKKLIRVELKGLQVRNKFSLNKIKTHMNRIAL
jgi:Ran GTPase-activating protein (RanGAP) involved in mRNA processing and transport